MKRYLFLPTIIIALILFSAFRITGDLPIGSALPKGDVAMKDISGKSVTMNAVKGQNGLLVMFTCNTCPYVMRNRQRTKAVCKYAKENKIGVILVNSNETQRNEDDSYEAMQTYAKEQGYQWPYVIDKDNIVADDFGAKRTPECFLFDKALKLVYKGAIDDNPGDAENVKQAYLTQAINALLNSKEITVKESRSVGCAIKRKNI